MTIAEIKALYEARKTSFAASLTKIKDNINVISNFRLLVVGVILILIYFALVQTEIFYIIFLLLFIFIFLVRRHTRLFAEKVHLENLVKINAREAKGVMGDYSSFQTGSEFIDGQHPYTHDLDIFGDGSLFQAINRCHTFDGKKKLANALSSLLASKEEIKSRQEAIRELKGKLDFRQHIEAAGWEMDELPEDRVELLHWLKQETFVYSKPICRYVLIVVPVVTVALAIGAFFSPVLKIFFLLMVVIQLATLGVYLKRINAFHESISRKKRILEKYSQVLHHLQQAEFSSAEMLAITKVAHQADVRMKRLASLVSSFNARSNSLMAFFVNGFLMYDLQYVYRLEAWKEKNKTDLEQWLEAISKTELLISFATFGYNHPSFIDAEINDNLHIEASELGHPLIDPKECITNSITIGNGPAVLIVTGANMAGKSTFLRTLGTNLVLALNGVPVFAKKFNCPLIRLRTGMRTADSLKDHQSYFYAELDRLKSIMDELRSNKPLLILLDEILKGTNSTDKQAGSIALVKQLLPHPCLAIIATHDLALGELEGEFPAKVKNFHFEPNIENDQLSFDYKLKPGIAQKMNATFLMKKMGIIPA